MKIFDFLNNKKRYNIVVIGSGQLGMELTKKFVKADVQNCIKSLKLLSRKDFEITLDTVNYNYIRKTIKQLTYFPDIIINCTAYTNTTEAENKEYNGGGVGYVDAFVVNAKFLDALSKVCNNHHIKLIHISTDYVNSQFGEEIPINNYGVTKLLGEKYIQCNMKKGDYLIIRTSWLYSMFSSHNFVYKFLKRCIDEYIKRGTEGGSKIHISIPSNQISSPTSADSLCSCIYRMVSRNHSGLIEFADDTNGVSRYDFAKTILETITASTQSTPYHKYFCDVELLLDDSGSCGKMYNGIVNHPQNSLLKHNINTHKPLSWEKILKMNIDFYGIFTIETILAEMKDYE